MALSKYMGRSLQKKNDDLNNQIELVETARDEMTSKFRRGLIKFSEIAPQIVASHGEVTDEMKYSVDKMYKYFKKADAIADDCNSEVSTALELSAVLKKKIKEKVKDLERNIRKHEREKEDAETERDRIKQRVKDAEERVESAKEEVEKAERNEKVGIVGGLSLTGAATTAGTILGGLLGGPAGAVAAGGIVGAIYGTGTVKLIEELEERVNDAKSDLSSRESELENKEEELEEIRDEIRDCKKELKSINKCLDQIEDLDRKVRRGQKHVANLSTHIKNSLTVIRTTVGKSKMLRDECLSVIVTFSALVKIVNDLAVYFKGENLSDFLSVSQNNAMRKAIKHVERQSHSSVSMGWLTASSNDFLEA